ncbi:MAG: TolC family protein, partial [Pseudomonadota bacterium]
MKPTKIAIGILLVLGVHSPVFGGDLMQIYHAAQSQDAVFAGARAAQQAGKEKLTQGRALLLPSVNLSANTTYNDLNSPLLTKKYNSHGYAVSVVQPVFREQNWATYQQADLQVAISEAQFKLAEQDVILRSAQTYFDVLIAQDTVQLTNAQKNAISQQLEQAKRNFEVGTATITDTHEAQARYDLVVAQEIAAANSLEIKKRTLQQLVNGEVDELSTLGAGFKLESPNPAEAQKWVADAQQGNYQIVIAQAAEALAAQEVAKNRGGHLPTVDAVGNYSNSTGCSFSCGDTKSISVGLQLNMPL